MKKKFKQFVAVVLTIILTLSVAPISAFALTTDESLSCLSYKIVDGEVTITDCDSKAADEIIVPETIEGYPVTTIGDNAFYQCNATKIILPDTVKFIWDQAFQNCYDLTYTNVPASVEYIADLAYYRCKIESFVVDENNKYYSSENNSLFNKDKTELIAFIKSGDEREFVVPSTVKVIKDRSFGYAVLDNVVLNDGLHTIESYAFEGSSIKSLTIPDSVTTIEDNAFSGCHYIEHFSFGKGITEIGNFFGANSTITNIVIQDHIKKIHPDAFSKFSEATTVTIGSGLEKFATNAFKNEKIKKYIVSQANENLFSEDGVVFNKDKTEIIAYPGAKEGTEYLLPDSVKVIGDYAFYKSRNLVGGLPLNDNIVTIGNYAFYDMSNVEGIGYYFFGELILPDSVEYIGDYAFYETLLEKVVFGNNVEYIGDFAFFNSLCYDVSEPSVFIPKSVKYIGIAALGGEIRPYFVNVDPENQNYSAEDNVLFNKDKTEILLFSDALGSSLSEWESLLDSNEKSSYVIPDSVEKISDYAFSYYSGPYYLTFGKNVKAIGSFAFCNNIYIKEIEFNYGLETVGVSAFQSCSISEINLPNTVSSIGEGAFYNSNISTFTVPENITVIKKNTYSRIVKIYIPTSVTKIEAYAFGKDLTDVYYEGTQEQWNKIEIEDGIDSVKNRNLRRATKHYGYSAEHEHIDGKWERTLEPTCTEKGEESLYCDICGVVIATKEIAATGHPGRINVKVYSNDCEKSGLEYIGCTVCDHIFSIVTPAVGHKAGEWQITKEPTCTNSGLKEVRCLTCKKSIESQEIEPLGHTAGEWVVTQAPTYTKGGEMTLYCSKCNQVMEIKAIDKLLSRVTDISLSDTKVYYQESSKLNLNISVEGSPKYVVRYYVGDDSVASVDGNGFVTGLKRGATDVTVVITDSNGNTYQDTCTVTVNFNFWQVLLYIFCFGWIWM